MIPIEKNPTVNTNLNDFNIIISRIAPRNQGVDIEVRCSSKYKPYYKIVIKELETGITAYESNTLSTSNIFSIDRLFNNTDYTAQVTICDYDGKELEHSNIRLFQTGYFPGKIINYNHPDDLTYAFSGRYLGSPNIIRLENGTYIASHDMFGGTGHGCYCQFFVSKNYGESWSYISSIDKLTWGNMFTIGDKIYILGVSGSPETSDDNTGDLVIHCSDNDCVSWNKATVIAKHTKEYSLRCSPTAFAEYNGRLWFYINNLCSTDKAGFQTAVASVPVDSDLMDEKNWTVTPFLKFDPNWEGAVGEPWGPCMFEEGNILLNREGELVMLLRYNSHRYDIPEADGTKIKVIMLKVNTENPAAPLAFKKIIPFNGTFSKFYIRYDEQTDLYYAMLNRMTTNKIWQRNVLSLFSSYDLEHWNVERDLINLEDLEWHEDNWHAGLQYPTWFIEGNDIIAAVRTAMNNAGSFHNANAITYHRFKNFRDKYKY